MKFQQTVVTMALAVYPALSFSVLPKVGRSNLLAGGSPSSKILQPRHRQTGINMILGNLFGGGGAFGQTIDYTALDFPGNELGEAAASGSVIVNSVKKPNLVAATFAGGCLYVWFI